MSGIFWYKLKKNIPAVIAFGITLDSYRRTLINEEKTIKELDKTKSELDRLTEYTENLQQKYDFKKDSPERLEQHFTLFNSSLTKKSDMEKLKEKYNSDLDKAETEEDKESIKEQIKELDLKISTNEGVLNSEHDIIIDEFSKSRKNSMFDSISEFIENYRN